MSAGTGYQQGIPLGEPMRGGGIDRHRRLVGEERGVEPIHQVGVRSSTHLTEHRCKLVGQRRQIGGGEQDLDQAVEEVLQCVLELVEAEVGTGRDRVGQSERKTDRPGKGGASQAAHQNSLRTWITFCGGGSDAARPVAWRQTW